MRPLSFTENEKKAHLDNDGSETIVLSWKKRIGKRKNKVNKVWNFDEKLLMKRPLASRKRKFDLTTCGSGAAFGRLLVFLPSAVLNVDVRIFYKSFSLSIPKLRYILALHTFFCDNTQWNLGTYSNKVCSCVITESDSGWIEILYFNTIWNYFLSLQMIFWYENVKIKIGLQ